MFTDDVYLWQCGEKHLEMVSVCDNRELPQPIWKHKYRVQGIPRSLCISQRHKWLFIFFNTHFATDICRFQTEYHLNQLLTNRQSGLDGKKRKNNWMCLYKRQDFAGNKQNFDLNKWCCSLLFSASRAGRNSGICLRLALEVAIQMINVLAIVNLILCTYSGKAAGGGRQSNYWNFLRLGCKYT